VSFVGFVVNIASLMVSPKMEVDPGGCPVQGPVAGEHNIFGELIERGTGSPSPVGPEPYAAFFRMHLAHAVPAPAAGSVPRVFGTLGFRAEERQVLNPAVAAFLAGK